MVGQRRHSMGWVTAAWALAALLQCTAPQALARDAGSGTTGVVGVRVEHLEAAHWVGRQAAPDAVALPYDRVVARNQRLLAEDDSTRDLGTLPDPLPAAQVRAWIEDLSARPRRTLYDAQGDSIGASTIDGWMAALDLQAIPASQPLRYGLVVQRADLRTFPTTTRVFSRVGDTDIDRFQENAFFPGTPVVVVHESRDRNWWFVVGELYAAWVEKRFIAEGDRTQVLGYGKKAPYLVVTGAEVRTTTTPEEPRVSDLKLDMGVRLPWLRDWPGTRAVNGQAPYASYVVEVPVRGSDGRLSIVPALLPRTSDVAPDYLPLTQANVLRQSFKFLGERYGWGHSYDARDCSGFVSEVYRSMGVLLPRNTSDQAVSPVYERTALSEADRAQREQAMRDLQVGDLVYIPGHVMMVIGHENGTPYVIHDTNGGSWLGNNGELVSGRLNGVSVTPLVPLRLDRERDYVDGVTNIQRLLPAQVSP